MIYHETEHGILYCGDCLDIMRTFHDDYIDLTITSPPYDGLRKYNGYSFDFENIAPELYRITKSGGVLVWVVGDACIDGSETGTSFRQALYFKEVGFNLHDTMIFVKNGYPFPEKTRYNQAMEYMFVLSKGKPKVFNPIKEKTLNRVNNRKSAYRQSDGTMKTEVVTYGENKNKTNVWKYGVGYMQTTKDKNAYKHPAMFPEQLAADHILSWSNPGDVVFDPFIGSGTTAKQAIMLGRKYIGCEISEEYCELAAMRLEIELDQQTIDL